MSTERFPIDYDTLQKGDYISPEDCERIIAAHKDQGGQRVTRAHRIYSLRLMVVADEIERECWKLGKRFRVVTDRDGLRVLTDPELAEYAREKFHRHERGLLRENAHARTVDVQLLTDDQRVAHERALIIQGAKLAALASARRALPKATERPALTGTEAAS